MNSSQLDFILRSIDKAFGSSAMHLPDFQMFNASSLPEVFELRTNVWHFGTMIDYDFIENNCYALPWLTNRALIMVLPTFLRHALIFPNSEAKDQLVSLLYFTSKDRNFSEGITQEQKKCLSLACLKFSEDYSSESPFYSKSVAAAERLGERT